MTAKVIAQVQLDAGGAAGAFAMPPNALESDPDGKPFVWRLDPKTMTVSKVHGNDRSGEWFNSRSIRCTHRG